MSSIPATNIPNVTELRQKLNYGDTSEARHEKFRDDLQAYLKNFITEDGTSGAECYGWKTTEAQAKLREIAKTYLDRDGRGLRFWPTDESDLNKNSMVYSLHELIITEVMMQLIFRLNQQRHRNRKYKGSRDPSHQVVSQGRVGKALGPKRLISHAQNRESTTPKPHNQSEGPTCPPPLEIALDSGVERQRAYKALQLPSQNSNQLHDLTPTPTRTFPAIEVFYTIVLSRHPVYRSRDWHPKCSFQDMSFAQLLSSMPFGENVETLLFTFEGPGLSMKTSMDCVDESRFSILKKRLNKGIHAALINVADSAHPLTYELELELPRDTAADEEDENNLESFL